MPNSSDQKKPDLLHKGAPEQVPPFMDLLKDPEYMRLVESYQRAEFKQCKDILEHLLKRYPDNRRLVEFEKDLDMQLSLQDISSLYVEKEKKEKKKLTLKMSAFTVAGIVLVAVVFAASFWFLSRAVLQQKQQNITSQLFSLDSQVNELLNAGQPKIAADILETMRAIDAEYPSIPVLTEKTNFLLSLETKYQDALNLLNAEDYSGALQIFKEIDQAAPGFWDVGRKISEAETKIQVGIFMRAGSDAYQAGKWSEVITAYESALELEPDLNDPTMKEQLLNGYLRRIIQMLENDGTSVADIQNAESYYRKAVTMIPQSRTFASERENLQKVSSSLLELKFTQTAKSLLEEKNQTAASIAQAVGYLNKAVNLNPNSAQLQLELQQAQLYQISFQYYMNMNWGMAIENLNKLLVTDQNYANGNGSVLLFESYYSQGNQFFSVGAFQDAKTNLEQAELLAYDDRMNLLKLFQVQMLLGDTLFKLGDSGNAITYYQYALNSAGAYAKAASDPTLGPQLVEADTLAKAGKAREAAMVYYLIHQQISRIYTINEVEAADGTCLAFFASQNLSTSDAITAANDLPKSSVISFGRKIKVPTLN